MSFVSKFKWGSFLGNILVGALGGGGGVAMGRALGGPAGELVGGLIGSAVTSGFSFGQPADQASALGQAVGLDALQKLALPHPELQALGTDLVKLAVTIGTQQLAVQAGNSGPKAPLVNVASPIATRAVVPFNPPNSTKPTETKTVSVSQSDWNAFQAWQDSQSSAPSDAPAGNPNMNN